LFRGQPRPRRKGVEPQRSPILGFSLCPHPFMQSNYVRKGNACGGGRVSWVSHASHPKGAEPHRSPSFLVDEIASGSWRLLSRSRSRSRSPILVFLLFVYADRRRTPEFGEVTRNTERGLFLGGQPSFIPRGVTPADPHSNHGGSLLLMHIRFA